MNATRLHIIVFLAFFPVAVYAQVIDTTISINTWLLMHNYSRFEDTKLDTTMFALHKDTNPLYRNGWAYETIGVLGNAAQNLHYLDRPSLSTFLFGRTTTPYMATPDRTIFYNTRKPFTEITYSNIPGFDWSEETIRFLHTQNMDPFSNIGIDLELLSGKELFDNEDSQVTKFTLFGSRAKDKYSAFGTFHFNRFNNKENGGLVSPEAYRADSLEDKWNYPTRLSEASSGYTNIKLFYTQKFTITEKLYSTDTLGVTTDSGSNLSFNHQLMVERNVREYTDRMPVTLVSDFYDNFYYHVRDIKDSAIQDQIINTFQFILGDPYTDPLSARVYAGHEFARYGDRYPHLFQTFSHYDTISQTPLMKDTSEVAFTNDFSNELFVGFHLSGPPENLWYWNVDAKYYLAGYYRNNFNANATFSRQVFVATRLGLKGSIENRNVSFFHNNYASAFFRWNNDFKASQVIRGEAFLQNDDKGLEFRASSGIITNQIYWDHQALPAQYEKLIYVMTGQMSAKLSVAGFTSINRLLVQYTSASDIIRLPLAAFKSSNYYETSFFKGALIAQAGIDFYITTPYLGNKYMPATGIFYLQDRETVGGYPYTDVYLALRIKRTRLFGSFNNGFGLLNSNHFTTAGYPLKSGFARIGLSWTFYD
ncbi:putative porin [Bacteroidota bacterium]